MLKAVALGLAVVAAATSLAMAEAVTFQTEQLVIRTDDGPVELTVEIADTPERRGRGYMERVDIGPDDGMLFVFGQPRRVSMWMQNTPTSLDMVFLLADGTVESIRESTVPFSRDIVSSAGEVSFVLEVLGGMSARWGLEAGDRLESSRFANQ